MFQNQAGAPTAPKQKRFSPMMLVLVLLVLLVSLQAATQYFAWTFQYQAALSWNIGGHFYAPWAIVAWSMKWGTQYPTQINTAFGIGTVIASVGMIILLISYTLWKNTARAHSTMHGSARWANKDDIKAAGLLNNNGVYVGAWDEKDGTTHYLRHDGPEHILTYAPTRSGKGVGLVIPTLLSWGHSAVITDMKGELWALTAGWRHDHAKNKTLRFEPARKGSVCWNPLDEIRIDTEFETGDAQNLALLIVDPDGRGLDSDGVNAHWKKTAFALLTGVILHALYKSRNEGSIASLATVGDMLSDPDRPIEHLWQEMRTYDHTAAGTNRNIAAAAKDMEDRPKEEGGSVLSTAKSYLSLYRDPIVAENTSRSDFRISDLMNHHDPVSLYIVTEGDDKTRLKPLVRILLSMIIRILASGMEFEDGKVKKHYKHRLLLMLDEFPSIGKMDILQEGLAYMAGYGIKAYLICQDINQLKDAKAYGVNESITSNCQVQNAFQPDRLETAEHLSRLTGTTTTIKEQKTTSGSRAAFYQKSVSVSFQEAQRPLLTPDECMRMPPPKKQGDEILDPGHMIIYVSGLPAIYGRQPLYFKDPIFKARSMVKPPEQSDRLSYSSSILRTKATDEEIKL